MELNLATLKEIKDEIASRNISFVFLHEIPSNNRGQALAGYYYGGDIATCMGMCVLVMEDFKKEWNKIEDEDEPTKED